jgi:CheY-like chemotaxis protein
MNIREGDPLRSYVDRILLSSEKAATLTQSLLAFSRKQRIQLTLRNINDIVKSAAELLARLLPEDIELRLKLTGDRVIAMADATQIDQVLMNLTTNARDAMPKGGLLTIETSIVTDASIDIEGPVKPGSYGAVSVSDTGSGMDEQTRKRVFEPFFTTKEVGKGTGLGLSSVYGIVKQHEGYITVSSRPGEGTVFYTYLPLVQVEQRLAAPATEKPVGGTETILIAEDDPDVRSLTSHILGAYGYAIIETKDGEDAIRAFNMNKDAIDLLILDVVMPKKNGKEVFEEMRKTNPAIKVLFVSGYTRDAAIDMGIESEIIDFVAKPLMVNELATKVRAMLDGTGNRSS